MRPRRSALVLCLAGFLLAVLGPPNGWAQQPDADPAAAPPLDSVEADKDVPYVTTPQRVVERMLALAGVSEDDVVYDLGSGDGRFVITAAQQFGARAVGVEIDSQLVQQARSRARRAGVADRVAFRQENLFEANLREATVVILYLDSDLNLRLRPKLLLQLDPGDRVVSHGFGMGNWTPDRVEKMRNSTIYLWTVPDQIPNSLDRP